MFLNTFGLNLPLSLTLCLVRQVLGKFYLANYNWSQFCFAVIFWRSILRLCCCCFSVVYVIWLAYSMGKNLSANLHMQAMLSSNENELTLTWLWIGLTMMPNGCRRPVDQTCLNKHNSLTTHKETNNSPMHDAGFYAKLLYWDRWRK